MSCCLGLLVLYHFLISLFLRRVHVLAPVAFCCCCLLQDARADAEDMIYCKLSQQLDEFFACGMCQLSVLSKSFSQSRNGCLSIKSKIYSYRCHTNVIPMSYRCHTDVVNGNHNCLQHKCTVLVSQKQFLAQVISVKFVCNEKKSFIHFLIFLCSLPGIAEYDWMASNQDSSTRCSSYIADLVAFLRNTFMSLTMLPVSRKSRHDRIAYSISFAALAIRLLVSACF